MSLPNQKIIDAIAAGKKVQWKFIRHGQIQDSGFVGQNTHGARFIALIKNDKDYEFSIMPDMVQIGTIEVVAPLKEVEPEQLIHIAEADGTVTEFKSASANDYSPFIIARTAFATKEAALAYRNALKILLK